MKEAKTFAAFLIYTLLLAPIMVSADEDGWQQIGHANDILAMAAMHGRLYAVSRSNQLWVREPVQRDVRWQLLGNANRVRTLAAANGKIFGVTMDHKLWMRDASGEERPWHHIGYADGVVAMTAMAGKLYAVTLGNKLLTSHIAPWNIRWQRLGEVAQVMAMASLEGKLFAVTKDHRLMTCDPAIVNAPWEYLGEGKPIVALAGLGGKLYAATKDNRLWVRSPPDSLQLLEISLEPPDWLAVPNAGSKATVSMTFNREVSSSTWSVPATLALDLRTLTTGRSASRVHGTLHASADARTLVFISERMLAELLRPQPGELIEYRVTLVLPKSEGSFATASSGRASGQETQESTTGRIVRVLQKTFTGPPASEGRIF